MTFRDIYEKYWCPISPASIPPRETSGLANLVNNTFIGWRFYLITLSIISITLFLGAYSSFVSFGLLLILSLSIHWIWGWADLPFLGTSVPFMAGGFVVSSITTRIVYLIARFSGLDLISWGGVGWIENSEANSALASEWLGGSPVISIGLILFSLCIAFFVGGFTGWLITSPGLNRSKVLVAIVSYVLVDAGSWFALKVVELSGGYTGVYVPDLFMFAGENRLLVLTGMILFTVFIGLLGYNRLRGSHFGLEVKSKADTNILGRAVFLGCGLIGVAGCLLSFYYGFVVQANFYGISWSLHPLLIFLIAGSGGGFGLALGVCVLMFFQYSFQWSRTLFQSYLFFPVALMYQLETGLVLLLACFYYLKKTRQGKQPAPFEEAK